MCRTMVASLHKSLSRAEDVCIHHVGHVNLRLTCLTTAETLRDGPVATISISGNVRILISHFEASDLTHVYTHAPCFSRKNLGCESGNRFFLFLGCNMCKTTIFRLWSHIITCTLLSAMCKPVSSFSEPLFSHYWVGAEKHRHFFVERSKTKFSPTP